MSIGSLFAGIGGLELGLEAAGLGPVRWQVEIDPFCRSILAKHWPRAQRFDDVRTVGRRELARVGIICGGFPCQDLSLAGAGAGLTAARSGLWFQFSRVVGELRPRIVVVENGADSARRWLPRVRADLRGHGYHTRAYRISAADVGAGHLRRRMFVVAYLDHQGQRQPQGSFADERRRLGHRGTPDARPDPHAQRRDEGQRGEQDAGGITEPHHDAVRARSSQRRGERGDAREEIAPSERAGSAGGAEQDRQPQSPLVRGVHGLPDRVVLPRRFPAALEADQFAWEPSRLAPRRKGDGKAVSALGNAVVPQVAYIVGCIVRALLEGKA